MDTVIMEALINGKSFAPDYPRTDTGLVKFPRADTDLRNLTFPNQDPTVHPVKANAYMVRELVRFVSEPGETICDPFAGTGTILVGATEGRTIVCIELEPPFLRLIEQTVMAMKQEYPDIEDRTLVIAGDCRLILPVKDFCNHLIFSPPYSNVLRKKGQLDQFTKDAGYGSALDYSANPNNIANLSDFVYFQVMERTYKKFYESLTVGGTMTIIIKDRISAGKRIGLADRSIKICKGIGFELVARNRWEALGGGYASYNRSIGLETVDEEDLLTLRRIK
jgi:DNA modification methylase